MQEYKKIFSTANYTIFTANLHHFPWCKSTQEIMLLSRQKIRVKGIGEGRGGQQIHIMKFVLCKNYPPQCFKSWLLKAFSLE